MTIKQTIDTLWEEFRESITQAYKAQAPGSDEAACLRDYALDISWHDELAKLLGQETANERQHRHNPGPKDFPVGTAAKLLLMNNAADGIDKTEMPSALTFIMFRRTAAEAGLLGWLARKHIRADWKASVRSLDYAKLMNRK